MASLTPAFRCVLAVTLFATAVRAAPLALCTPGASVEAVALYSFLQDTAGHGILSGQHCVPLVGSTRLGAVQKMTERYPAVFSQDFGFSEAGTWDGINFRQQIVDEAIRRSSDGFVINLMWHAVRPADDEPVHFNTSIQGKLTDVQWRELLTPGTQLNERWKSQVDVIAFFLKQLDAAHVPVLWRPYHEMNGDWFWWGGRPGPDGSAKLYRQLYARLVTFHHLHNLVWIFGANEVGGKVGAYADYYPGDDVVDVLATDVYRNGFARADYDSLLALAKGRPIALAEVGPLPPLDVLKAQPRWAWFTVWGEPGRDWRQTAALYQSEQVITLDELPWVTVKHPTIHYPMLK